ncbi:MAG: hypothetical protein EA359_09050 [Balneolaceae bacterium]|nr:MAG: hypothetical protein EA359_09050 [Balneolaceae bacterium]
MVISYFQWRKYPPVLLEKALAKPASIKKQDEKGEAGWAKKLWIVYRQKAFWVPLAVVFVVLLLSGSSTAELAGLPLRAAGIVTAIFVIFSIMKPRLWIYILRKRGYWGAAIILERIIGRDDRLMRNK